VLILIPIFLVGCTSSSVRNNQADTLSTSGGFEKEIVKTSHFYLLTYQKISESNQIVSIYIEGDGLAYLDSYRPSLNPTPIDPVSLKLAVLDPSPNVLYIARPCQYVPREVNPNCQNEYWTSKRYSPEVVESINETIDKIKNNNKLQDVRLIGFSGGGSVAAILAATRTDVIDLRTVAGNLDTTKFTRLHNTSPLTGSLNPVDYADKLKDIPQIHFIGADDDIVPIEVVYSYQEKIKKFDPDLHCVTTQSFANTSHTEGWEDIWKKSILQVVACRN
jgi:pimeloyl-ACP methyl ester carboxylesterase